MDLIEPNFGFEDSTWYGTIRARAVELILSEEIKGDSDIRILDYGCGNGETLKFLSRSALRCLNCLGFDPNLLNDSKIGDKILLTNNIQSLADSSFDCVLLMDVLEHVVSPQEILSHAFSLVAPKGRLIITVPAYRWAWSQHDVALGHHDRYTKLRLLNLLSQLEKVGNVKSGYLFPTIFLLSLPFKILNLSKNSLKSSQKFSWILERIGKFEARLGARFIFGISVIAIVEKGN